MQGKKLTKLENGLTVVTKSVDTVASVALGYWVSVGGVNEAPLESGISHFLEHMAFKGTKTRSAKDIAVEIESVGGYSNAYTSKEVTAYHAKFLKENVNSGIDILSDIMLNSVFNKMELERERGVILQEISQTYDAPDDIIFDYFQEVAFKNQSLGRSILGPAAIVSKITSNDLRRYREKFYNADNIVFAAAGNISHDEVLELANKYFLEFNIQKTPPHDETYQYVGGEFSDVRELEQEHVIIGFEGIASLNPDYYTMAVLSSILGSGMSSRLFQEVREKRGLVYSVYSFASSYRRNGLFGIYAATSANKLEELADVAVNELLKMTVAITEEEFSRTKTQFKASLLMSGESNTASCDQIASQTMLFGKPLEHAEMLEKLNKVSINDVIELAKRIVKGKCSVVTVGKADCRGAIRALQKNGVY